MKNVDNAVINCWDYFNCEEQIKTKCPAFTTDSGRECWRVAGSFNKQPYCPKVKNNISQCYDCEWFKKVNPEFEKK